MYFGVGFISGKGSAGVAIIVISKWFDADGALDALAVASGLLMRVLDAVEIFRSLGRAYPEKGKGLREESGRGTFGIDTFVEDKVLGVLFADKGIATVRAAQSIVFDKAVVIRGEREVGIGTLHFNCPLEMLLR